jgi:putative spermidine/putrescine transport system permease protein
MKRKYDLCDILLTAAVFVVMLFVVGPLLIVLATSVNPARIVFPPDGVTFKWFADILRHDAFIRAAGISALVAFCAALGSTGMGCMVCVAFRYFKVPGKNAAGALFSAPILVPAVIIGLALYQTILVLIGSKSLATLIAGHAVITMPFPIRIVGSMLETVDPSKEEAAMSVGANRVTTFLRITFPMIRPAVVGSALYSAILSWNNFPVSMFLCGLGYVTLPIRIYNYLEYRYEPLIAAMGAVVVLISALFVWLIDKYIGLGSVYGKGYRQ